MQTADTHTNRSPRTTPTRPGVYRRLHRWLKACALRRRIHQVKGEIQMLRHLMAQDEAMAAVHRLQYTKSPVLQQRRAEDAHHLARLHFQHQSLRAELQRLECGQ